MLQGMEMRLSRECEVPVHLTDDPLATVVLGAGRLLEYLPEYQAAFASADGRGRERRSRAPLMRVRAARPAGPSPERPETPRSSAAGGSRSPALASSILSVAPDAATSC